jgi:hypothetical protein
MVFALLYENQTSVVMLESSSRPCLPPKQTEALPGNPLERGGSETTQSREQTSEPERRVVSLTEPPPAAADDRVDNRDAVGDATTPPPIEITWILPRDLDRFKDVFAASWWQTMSRFMEFDVEEIHIVEDDAFKPIMKAGNGFNDVRMARDWLDFSLEHLSKWWKIGGSPAMMYGIGKLQSYIHKTVQTPLSSTAMNTTLAIIPYGVNVRGKSTDEQMWTTALAATIASLMQFGVARVVVVGHYEADYRCTKGAFQQLMRYQAPYGASDRQAWQRLSAGTTSARHPPKLYPSFSGKFGATELAFVHTDDVNSTFIPENIPKGALKGLQLAMNGSNTEEWLGKSPSKYKYLFLTEADQILNGRLTFLFTQELDKGRIIIPHRLQPIPHLLDLRGIVPDDMALPREDFPDLSVYELDAATDSCCDTATHVDKEKVKGCGAFWWQCGLEGTGNFSHLQDYSVMRLTQGTGIVSLAATEHSRRCHPQKNQRKCVNPLSSTKQ